MVTDVPVFKRVSVGIAAVTGYPTVEWDLRTGWSPQISALFYVDYSPDLSDWTALNTTPVTSVYLYEDATRRRHRVVPEVYYRVRLVDGEDVHTSQAAGLLGHFTAETFRRAREVMRQEYTRLIQHAAGRAGYLLKKKRWGTVCPVCRDFDTGEVIDSKCTTCYGTGIVGGYYAGYSLYVDFAGEGVQQTQLTEAGKEHSLAKVVRCPAFPLLEAEDVWVAADNDERYVVGSQIKHLAEMHGTPLIYAAAFRLIEPGSIEYSVPLE